MHLQPVPTTDSTTGSSGTCPNVQYTLQGSNLHCVSHCLSVPNSSRCLDRWCEELTFRMFIKLSTFNWLVSHWTLLDNLVFRFDSFAARQEIVLVSHFQIVDNRGTKGESNSSQLIEFEWNIFPGFSTSAILQEIQRDLERKGIDPEQGRNHLHVNVQWHWSQKQNNETSISNAGNVKEYAMKFSQGHWTFLGLGSEEKWNGKYYFSVKGEWDSPANKMVQRFKETGHFVFKSINAFEWRNPEEEEEETVHCNRDSTNIEILFHSFCKSAQYLRSSGELVWTIRPDRAREGTSQFVYG